MKEKAAAAQLVETVFKFYNKVVCSNNIKPGAVCVQKFIV